MSDFSDSDMEESSDDHQFNKAAEHLQRSHADYTPNDLLELYALYKQATIGACQTSKPGIFNMQGRAKWNAWHDLGAMSSAEAKRQYVTKLTQLDPQWSKKKQQLKSPHNWVVHSVQLPPSEDVSVAEHEKTSFDYVKEGNLERLRATLMGEQLQQLDDCGLGLLHWATDRNSADILEYLLSQGADVNLQDVDGQTALHYAASCAHMDCLQILVNSGASKTLRDTCGLSCMDVAEDVNIRKFLEL